MDIKGTMRLLREQRWYTTGVGRPVCGKVLGMPVSQR